MRLNEAIFPPLSNQTARSEDLRFNQSFITEQILNDDKNWGREIKRELKLSCMQMWILPSRQKGQDYYSVPIPQFCH